MFRGTPSWCRRPGAGTTLPATALPALTEAMTVLKLTPWNGRPINPDNPDGAIRTLAFGSD